jgi:hypothetical protein
VSPLSPVSPFSPFGPTKVLARVVGLELNKSLNNLCITNSNIPPVISKVEPLKPSPIFVDLELVEDLDVEPLSPLLSGVLSVFIND